MNGNRRTSILLDMFKSPSLPSNRAGSGTDGARRSRDKGRSPRPRSTLRRGKCQQHEDITRDSALSDRPLFRAQPHYFFPAFLKPAQWTKVSLTDYCNATWPNHNRPLLMASLSSSCEALVEGLAPKHEVLVHLPLQSPLNHALKLATVTDTMTSLTQANQEARIRSRTRKTKSEQPMPHPKARKPKVRTKSALLSYVRPTSLQQLGTN